MMLNQISFKANLISPAKILERNSTGTFEPKTVSFVELNPEHNPDMNAIMEVNQMWDNRRTLASNIVEEMHDSMDFFEHAGKRFFAITEQADSLENIEPSKVLGLTETIQGNYDNIKIKFFLVDPKYQRGQKNAPFKHVGTSLLESLKELFPNKTFSGQSTPEAVKFYLANGFQKLDANRNMKFIR